MNSQSVASDMSLSMRLVSMLNFLGSERWEFVRFLLLIVDATAARNIQPSWPDQLPAVCSIK